MTINYDWYTTYYRHMVTYPYATLIVQATVIINPSRSVGLKKSVDLIFKFQGQFHNFRDAGTTYQNPGLSWTTWDVWHFCP